MQQQLIVQIPAAVGGVAGVLTLPANYKVFSCIATTGIYTAQTKSNTVAFLVDSAGRGFGTATGPSYGLLILTNSSAGIITTTIYLGDDVLPQSFVANTIAVAATVTNNTLTSQQILKNVAAAGTAVALAAAGTNFVRCKIIAVKTLARGANTGNVYLGNSGVGNNQPMTLAPGDEIDITAPANVTLRFQDFFLNADNNGDGVAILSQT